MSLVRGPLGRYGFHYIDRDEYEERLFQILERLKQEMKRV